MHQILLNERKQELDNSENKQMNIGIYLQLNWFLQITFQTALNLSHAGIA